MDEPMLDPMGALIVELRSDTDLSSLVSTRVRGFEPASGDAKPAGSYQAFIVLVTLDAPPERRVPIVRATFGATCYGSTAQNASAVYGALVKAIHEIGPRLKSNGLGIYSTAVISGGEQGKDPDTQQPLVHAVISLIATTQAVTA